MNTFGRHLLVEFFGCDGAILDSVSKIENAMTAAVEAAGATRVGSCFHKFEPMGASGVIVLSESHISIHTWPEKGYAALDFYTCGDCDPKAGIEYLLEGLKASDYEMVYVERGTHPDRPSMNIVEHRVSTPAADGPQIVAKRSA